MRERTVFSVLKRYLRRKKNVETYHILALGFRILNHPYDKIADRFEITIEEAKQVVKTTRKQLPQEVLEQLAA